MLRKLPITKGHHPHTIGHLPLTPTPQQLPQPPPPHIPPQHTLQPLRRQRPPPIPRLRPRTSRTRSGTSSRTSLLPRTTRCSLTVSREAATESSITKSSHIYPHFVPVRVRNRRPRRRRVVVAHFAILLQCVALKRRLS